MQVKIRTSDKQWTAEHSERTDDGAAVVTIPGDKVERVTFAGREMVRFDLRIVGKLPADWPNAWAMLPSTYVVG